MFAMRVTTGQPARRFAWIVKERATTEAPRREMRGRIAGRLIVSRRAMGPLPPSGGANAKASSGRAIVSDDFASIGISQALGSAEATGKAGSPLAIASNRDGTAWSGQRRSEREELQRSQECCTGM